ncbi:MAG: right-handed parallel beta-helix repeat-containing protein [Thermoplasmata archaeon]|nr:right-handed parallel beta-helix repeat-containing protein [Thermoplasmata archaeon]
MKSLWRAFCISVLLISAAAGGLLLSEEARAGTPVIGDIVVDTVWSPSDSPYWIETDVRVLPGVELLVSAGTEVRFNGLYMLLVEGKLLVQGSAIDPVVFTHNSTTPSPGDWTTIYVSGEAHINYANVSYADYGFYIDSSYNTVNDSFFYRNNYAIALESGSDNLIRNNNAINSTESGINVWQSNSNELIGNNVTGSNNTGIWLYEATGNLIQQNTLYLNSWNGIRIERTSSSNMIVDNTVLESQTYQGIGVWGSHDNWILNNTIRGNKRNGIYLEQSSGNNISWNDISDSADYHGISLFLADSNLMIGNQIHGIVSAGLRVESSFGNRIQENTIHNNSGGVAILGSPMTEITGNNITSSTDGIRSWSSPGSNITSNTISWIDNIGIYLEDDNDIAVVDNDFLWNTGSAVFASSSDQVVITNNDFFGNGWGVYLMSSSNVTILENNFTSNNIFGVSLSFSRDVSVYHNNFISNANQASDVNGAGNEWDDGYPSGGNYWSDYTGFDIYSGPDQDRLGSDSIGDTPYVIDFDSMDRYPLTSPYPPLAPMPPFPFSAVLTGTGSENVTLTWEISPDDGQRLNSVVRYEIYRNSSYDSRGLGYQFLGSVPNGTSQFIDVQAGEGDSNNYFYRICAVDFNNTARCSGEQLGKFTMSLGRGPNLASIPLIQSNETIQTVLQTLSFDNAWSYNPINQEWKSSVKSKPYDGTLEYVNRTMGLWVNVTQDSNFTIAGVVPTSTAIHLHAGWNLVGFPSFDDSYTVANLKGVIAVDRVEGFDGTAPPYFLRAMTDGNLLQAGSGYWINMANEATWIITNS